MFENFIAKLYRYTLKKKAQKQQKNQQSKVEQERAEMYHYLKLTYQFVRWLNTKGIGNRHARKAFWKKVIDGEQLEEKVLVDLLSKFSKKEVENILVPEPKKKG